MRDTRFAGVESAMVSVQLRRVPALAVSAIASIVAAASLGAQQQPAFRAGVDLMSVDVAVVDKSGAPVTSLSAADFAIALDKKPRRIVAADFVSSVRGERAAAFRSAPAASTNLHGIAPRTLVFLVDTEQIPSGGGRVAIKSIGEYLDRLNPDDRVGVMTLLDNRVPPTTNRAPAREVFDKLIGTSARLRDREMTFGEAAGVATRDRRALLAYWSRIADQGSGMPNDRTCSPPQGYESVTTVSQVCVSQAELAIERFRFESRRVINRLVAVADAMATIPEPKSIVLVSGGLFVDEKLQTDLKEFARLAERARVSLSAVFIEPDGSGGGSSNADTKRLDSQTGFGGLVDLATIARGSAHRVVSTSAPALTRLDRELSGYYVVSFERDPEDAAGKTLELELRSTRADVTVMSRKVHTPGRAMIAPVPDTAATDLKSGVTALLRSSTPVAGVPMSIDAFAMPASAGGSEARVILAIEMGRDAAAVSALGFQFADAGGKVLGDGYEAPAKVVPIGPGRSLFVTGVAAASGRFVVRAGAIDSKGQRGSLQHSFEIAPWPQGQVRLSDLMFGSVSSGEFTPGAGSSADGRLAMRLIVRDNSQKFDALRVQLVVARAADGTPVDEVEIPLQQTPDAFRRFADASIRMDAYPAGDYAVTMTVTAQGREVGKSSRVFTRPSGF